MVYSFDLLVRSIAIQSGRAYTFAPFSQITDAVDLPRAPPVGEWLCDRRAARTHAINQTLANTGKHWQTLVNEAFVQLIDHKQVEVQYHAYLFGETSRLMPHILA